MAARIKKHDKWKDVKIDPNIYLQDDFSSFVCMQELTDYDIVDSKGKVVGGSVKKRKKKSRPKKNTDVKEESEESLSLGDKKKKKKRKLQDGKIETKETVNDELPTKKRKAKRKIKSEKELDDVPSREKRGLSNDCQADKKSKLDQLKKRKLESSPAPVLSKRAKKGVSQPVKPPDMSAWHDMFVPDPVLRALGDMGFTAPTPIQTLTMPHAIRDRMDIVGAAETGSGKTLAFGIPLLHRILQLKQQDSNNQSSTSELRQTDLKLKAESPVDDDLSDTSDSEDMDVEHASDLEPDESHSDTSASESDMEGQSDSDASPAEESTGQDIADSYNDGSSQSEVIGRIVPEKPLYALILTPTRELAIQVKDHIVAAAKHTGIKVITITGGMAVQKQLRLLHKCPEIVVATPGRLWELLQEGDPHLSKACDVNCLVIDEADRMVEKGHFEELTQLLQIINSDEQKKKKRQTFVFSATLTFVHSGPQRLQYMYKKKMNKMDEKQKLETLMTQIGVKPKPKIIDLTRSSGTAENLTEARINTPTEDKDIYLYYFLRQFPGRTLVFANSKDCIRRLVSIFKLLQCCPLPLHADMHQRQRLKNLDRFKDNPRSLLLATDVAARGLDIPDVQHVVHYQVPRTTENYVHRSGRTARASKEGLSVMLVGPEDLQYYRKISASLNRDEDLPLFPIDQDILNGVKVRVNLARSVDKDEHRISKQKRENEWFEKTAREVDVELDENQLLNNLGDEREMSQGKKKLSLQREQLKHLLMGSLQKKYSGKYPTKSGRLPQLLGSGGGAISKVKEEHHKDRKLLAGRRIQQPNKQDRKREKKLLKKKKVPTATLR